MTDLNSAAKRRLSPVEFESGEDGFGEGGCLRRRLWWQWWVWALWWRRTVLTGVVDGGVGEIWVCENERRIWVPFLYTVNISAKGWAIMPINFRREWHVTCSLAHAFVIQILTE